MSSVNNIGVNQVLAQIRQLQSQQTPLNHTQDVARTDNNLSLDGLNASQTTRSAEAPGFAEAMTATLDAVNNRQQSAGDLARRFEEGDPSVKLSSVMIEMQKSRIAFEATAQVRNRVVAAYQDIMNMQI